MMCAMCIMHTSLAWEPIFAMRYIKVILAIVIAESGCAALRAYTTEKSHKHYCISNVSTNASARVLATFQAICRSMTWGVIALQ